MDCTPSVPEDYPMRTDFKKISDQVIVITGATSGIGLTTAHLAARRGAKVVASSRNEFELRKLVSEIRAQGGEATYSVADVADTEAVQHLADVAVQTFGRIDTWVNNAGVTIYGKLTEIGMNEKRRLFDVNFWGVVNGCRAAVPHLRERGGVIVNIGSTLSDRTIPLQGIYCASKHAVKSYTDALRMELERDGVPIALTLVKPAAINTPYTLHARNHLGTAATNPPPVYAPEVVARAILKAAESGPRDLFAGGAAKLFSLMEKYMPRTTDQLMERILFQAQKKVGPVPSQDSLFSFPPKEGCERGDYRGLVFKHSAYTAASLHPLATLATLGAAIGAAGLLATGVRRGKISPGVVLGVIMGLFPARTAAANAKRAAKRWRATRHSNTREHEPMHWAGTRNLQTHEHLNRKTAA